MEFTEQLLNKIFAKRWKDSSFPPSSFLISLQNTLASGLTILLLRLTGLAGKATTAPLHVPTVLSTCTT